MKRKTKAIAAIITGIVAVSVAIGYLVLHGARKPKVAVQNRSGQTIDSISIALADGFDGYRLTGIENGETFTFELERRSFDGKLNVAQGQLHDGTRLFAGEDKIEGDSYDGMTTIIVLPKGKIRIVNKTANPEVRDAPTG